MLLKNILLIVLILLSNEDDRSLLQSQRAVLWVVAEKRTQLALRVRVRVSLSGPRTIDKTVNTGR